MYINEYVYSRNAMLYNITILQYVHTVLPQDGSVSSWHLSPDAGTLTPAAKSTPEAPRERDIIYIIADYIILCHMIVYYI